MHCFACENEATQQCQRCARLYCNDHGDNLCAECLNPASAVPSPFIYRGSLLALVVGTAVVVWLLVAPSALPGDSVDVDQTEAAEDTEDEDEDVGAVTSTPVATESEPPSVVTAEPDNDETTPSPTAAASDAGSCPEGSEASGADCVYVVQEGDTIISIANSFGVSEQALRDANDIGDELIQAGQTLIIPTP
jgi:LysM repeat protein